MTITFVSFSLFAMLNIFGQTFTRLKLGKVPKNGVHISCIIGDMGKNWRGGGKNLLPGRIGLNQSKKNDKIEKKILFFAQSRKFFHAKINFYFDSRKFFREISFKNRETRKFIP